ncbi:MAG: hypothetical protein J1G38_01115 [Clostridiales bacterium]|nr:hypothetical protein [Clostridiales bacterium]
MKRKSLLALVLALVMSIAAVFALVGCGGGESGGESGGDKRPADTSFVGCLSAATYEDEESAAIGFLSAELDGAATKTQFVGAEKGDELSEEEIAALELGDDIDVNDVESAAHYTVKYTETEVSDKAHASAESAKSYKIVIIKIGSHYYYYIPVMPKGGAITNSYIAMVCDPKKYVNVTETSVGKSTTTVQGYSVTVTLTTTTKLAGDRAHIKLVSSILGETQIEEYYLVTENESLVMYYYDKYDDSWENFGSAEYATLEQLLEDAVFNFDHTYFERTASGFKMSSGKLRQYLNDVMGDDLKALLGRDFQVKSASADYYVKDARLDEVKAKITMKGVVEGMSTTATVSTTTKYTDYGTTVIDLPFSIEE